MTVMTRVGNWRLDACVAEAYQKPRKPQTPPFTSIEQRAVYGAYQRGMTMDQIAATYGCSRWTISRTIHRQHRKQGR